MNSIDERVIDRACQALQDGGIILYPTETAYALGCDARNAAAVNTIFEIKRRVFIKAMPLIAAHTVMVGQFAFLDAQERALAHAYWPGPLTLIVHAREDAGLAPLTIADDGTIAIRVSGLAIARHLSDVLGAPIVSTSANHTGEPLCYSVQSVLKQLGDDAQYIDAIVDMGWLPELPPSTIARVTQTGLEVVRQGSVIL